MMNTKNLFCFSLFIGLVITSPARKLHSDRRYCGYQHTDDYPRLNNNISIDEFPWMVQLLYGEDLSVRCSGSLINRRYVLTTGNCVYSKLNMVRLGDYNVKTENDCVDYRGDDTECSDPVYQIPIEQAIAHPSFSRTTGENDIALLRLAKNVDFSDYIRPICLPEKNAPALKSGDELAVSGWGLLSFNGTATDLKKRVIVSLVSVEECAKIYKNNSLSVTNDHLCASESDSFTCQGDSGGPLMYSVKNQWEQVGILSFATLCGPNFPTVYTKVSSYLDWIEENLRV